jgi:hypothetical protein
LCSAAKLRIFLTIPETAGQGFAPQQGTTHFFGPIVMQNAKRGGTSRTRVVPKQAEIGGLPGLTFPCTAQDSDLQCTADFPSAARE